MGLGSAIATLGGVATGLLVGKDGNGNVAAAHVLVDVNGVPVGTTASPLAISAPTGAAQDGVDATGITPPPGGVGMRGWLSGCYARLSAILTALNGTLAVSATALPLPIGAADAATLSAINTKLAALLAAEMPPQGAVAMIVGTAQTAQRAVRVNCTVAGSVSFTYADGTTDTVMANVGTSYVAGAITTINTNGTTAAATYANIK